MCVCMCVCEVHIATPDICNQMFKKIGSSSDHHLSILLPNSGVTQATKVRTCTFSVCLRRCIKLGLMFW